METRESFKSHEAIPVQDLDAPYAGQPGQTGFAAVHVRVADGSLASVSLCRTLNVQTHPELRERALAGALHRLADGRELALPFVYHDPSASLFVLVVPAVLAHTELSERSRLLAELAQDTQHPIPLYVRNPAVVVGQAAFKQYVQARGERGSNEAGDTLLPDDADVTNVTRADDSDVTDDAQAVHDARAKQDAQAARAHDARYAHDAQAVQGRAAGDRTHESRGTGDSHSTAHGQHVIDAADKAVAVLAARERSLLQRERELAEQERSLVRMADALTAREDDLSRQRQQLEGARGATELRERAFDNWNHADATTAAATQPAAFVDDLPAVAGMRDAAGRTHPPPLPTFRHHRTGPPPLPMRSLTPTAAQREPGVRGSVVHAPPPLPLHTHLSPFPARPREPEVAPPAYFAGQRLGQLALRLVADELWLFVHVDEADAAQLHHGAELFLQYIEVEGYPILLLSLVASTPGSAPLRLGLDGHSDADQRVLEHLSRSFRARVALYNRRRYVETLTVAALREGVAQAISERLLELPSDLPAISATDALLRVQHVPPPLTNDDLPFGPARREASTTASVHASVAQLAAWLEPEKLQEATLIYCTPRNVIDATLRRVLRAAVAFGIALPDELVERAIEQRVARDHASLLRAQLQAFRQRVEQGVNDLGAAATRKNWERLIAQAEASGLELDDAQRTLGAAHATGASLAGARADAPAAARELQELSHAELIERLDDAELRGHAIEELCARGQVSAVSLMLAALPKLPREQLPTAMAQLLMLGEQAGDALIGALEVAEADLRQLVALLLGRMRLKRALAPLIELLQRDDSGIDGELARALGDYGATAVQPLAEALGSPVHPERAERLILALTHVANHGGASAVEKLENDSDPAVAQAARKAMASRARLEWEDLAVRQQRTLEEGADATLLSQAFYAAAAKVAI